MTSQRKPSRSIVEWSTRAISNARYVGAMSNQLRTLCLTPASVMDLLDLFTMSASSTGSNKRCRRKKRTT